MCIKQAQLHTSSSERAWWNTLVFSPTTGNDREMMNPTLGTQSLLITSIGFLLYSLPKTRWLLTRPQ